VGHHHEAVIRFPQQRSHVAVAREPAGQERVGFPTVPGKRYRVERNDDFPTGTWNLIANNLIGTGSVLYILDSASASLPKAIYRVVLIP
jgi:hypothetical protein